QDGDLVGERAGAVELAHVGDEVASPPAAGQGVVPDHRPGPEGAVGGAAAEPVLAAGAGAADRVDPALAAGEHRVDDDAVAYLPPLDRRAGLHDPADVLVAEGEGEGGEGFEGQGVVRREGGEVAAADPAEGGLDADPVGAGEGGFRDVVVGDAAERTQREGGAPAGRPAGQQVAEWSVMEPDRVQTCGLGTSSA